MADIFAGPGVTYGSGSGTEGSPFNIKEALENLNTTTDRTVIMLNGVHTQGTIFNNDQNLWPMGTSEGQRQTVRAESVGGVTWRPTGSSPVLTFKNVFRYMTFEDIVFDYSNLTGTGTNGIHAFSQVTHTGLHHVTFDGVVLKYAPQHNIQIYASAHHFEFLDIESFDAGRLNTSLWNNMYLQGSNQTIRGCRAYYTAAWKGGYGGNGGNIRVSQNGADITTAGLAESENNLIEECYTRGGTIGIIVSGNNNTIRNNEVIDARYGSSNNGIQYTTQKLTPAGGGPQTTADNIQIYNNTVFNSSTAGTGIRFITFSGAVATNAKVKNNILRGFTNATLYDGATVDQANNLTADPGFTSTNPASFDLHIAEDGAADGTGADLSATGFTTDKDGLTRPQNGSTWCIGAYEVPSPPDNDPVVNRSETIMLAVTATSTPVPTITITDVDGNLTRALLTVLQGTLSASGAGGATIQTGT